jgi:hypothetical protein
MRLLRLPILALAFAVATAFTAAPVSAAPPTATSAVSIPISTSNATGSFVGAFTISNFAVQNGQLVAVGTLTGTVTNAITGATTTVSQALTLPVLATTTGTCHILHLELGPLDLNLLGVMVHLDKVVLDITAQSGPGNLLGNLLCAVAHLLDSNAAGNALANLLNQILAILQGL